MHEPAPSMSAGERDALHRCGAAQDRRNRTLFESAFADDAMLDFVGPAKRLGATIPVFEGRLAIAGPLSSATAALDTTHTITHPRVTAPDGERATLFALVEAPHLPRVDHGRHLLLENIHATGLSKDDSRRVIDRMRIDTVCSTGDPSVPFPKQDAHPENLYA